MQQILRVSFSVLWVSLVAVATWAPKPAEACAAGWTYYVVVSEDTPTCFSVTAAENTREAMYEPIGLFNGCAVDVTIEPMEGLCPDCPDTFVVGPGAGASLTVVGENNENTYRWSMEGKAPDLTDEGTIIVASDSVIPDCPGPFGCSATGTSQCPTWLLLPLMLLALLVMRRWLSARMSKPE
jgi:hypothetical protein